MLMIGGLALGLLLFMGVNVLLAARNRLGQFVEQLNHEPCT